MSLPVPPAPAGKQKLFYGLAALCLLSAITFGAFAGNGWLPRTDPLSGRRTGWFGREIPKNAPSSWNPVVAVLPTPTPTPLPLSKEYIYAGSRLLAVEDANASAVPPADLAIWRPSSGAWWVMGGTGSQQVTQTWGASGDTAVPGDYDGDGKTDFTVFRSSTSYWYFVNSSTGGTGSFPFGSTGDLPAVADYDGDGRTDVAVYRPSTGTWYILQSSTQNTVSAQFGLSSDAPAPADYDGDGRADVTVWRGSNTTFYTVRSSDATLQTGIFATSSTDTPVPADYDGDGKANYAVRSGAGWVVMNAALTSTTTTTPSGDLASDTPVPNDYDGDAKADIAVWRGSNGNWYIRQSASSGSLRQVQWGASGDIPVPAFFRR